MLSASKFEFVPQMIDSSIIGWELAALWVIVYRMVMSDMWREISTWEESRYFTDSNLFYLKNQLGDWVYVDFHRMTHC